MSLLPLVCQPQKGKSSKCNIVLIWIASMTPQHQQLQNLSSSIQSDSGQSLGASEMLGKSSQRRRFAFVVARREVMGLECRGKNHIIKQLQTYKNPEAIELYWPVYPPIQTCHPCLPFFFDPPLALVHTVSHLPSSMVCPNLAPIE